MVSTRFWEDCGISRQDIFRKIVSLPSSKASALINTGTLTRLAPAFSSSGATGRVKSVPEVAVPPTEREGVRVTSRSGAACRIYSTDCIMEPDGGSCRAVAPVGVRPPVVWGSASVKVCGGAAFPKTGVSITNPKVSCPSIIRSEKTRIGNSTPTKGMEARGPHTSLKSTGA